MNVFQGIKKASVRMRGYVSFLRNSIMILTFLSPACKIVVHRYMKFRFQIKITHFFFFFCSTVDVVCFLIINAQQGLN